MADHERENIPQKPLREAPDRNTEDPPTTGFDPCERNPGLCEDEKGKKKDRVK